MDSRPIFHWQLVLNFWFEEQKCQTDLARPSKQTEKKDNEAPFNIRKITKKKKGHARHTKVTKQCMGQHTIQFPLRRRVRCTRKHVTSIIVFIHVHRSIKHSNKIKLTCLRNSMARYNGIHLLPESCDTTDKKYGFLSLSIPT